MKKVYLVCGVPGSGKSWVCEQLLNRFDYVRHDDYIQGDYTKGIVYAAKRAEKPVLGDCPFGERVLVQELEKHGLEVTPLFIVEDPQLIKKRYEARDKKPFPPQHLTRAISIKNRAREWQAFSGKPEEVLAYLKDVTQ